MFSRAARRAVSSKAPSGARLISPIYEWRTDSLLSSQALAASAITLPAENGRLAAFKTEVGGAMNEVHRLYTWESFDARDAARLALPQHDSQPLISSNR